MKIDHVAMYVWDLEGAKEFFVRFFRLSRMICITIRRRD